MCQASPMWRAQLCIRHKGREWLLRSPQWHSRPDEICQSLWSNPAWWNFRCASCGDILKDHTENNILCGLSFHTVKLYCMKPIKLMICNNLWFIEESAFTPPYIQSQMNHSTISFIFLSYSDWTLHRPPYEIRGKWSYSRVESPNRNSPTV